MTTTTTTTTTNENENKQSKNTNTHTHRENCTYTELEKSINFVLFFFSLCLISSSWVGFAFIRFITGEFFFCFYSGFFLRCCSQETKPKNETLCEARKRTKRKKRKENWIANKKKNSRIEKMKDWMRKPEIVE